MTAEVPSAQILEVPAQRFGAGEDGVNGGGVNYEAAHAITVYRAVAGLAEDTRGRGEVLDVAARRLDLALLRAQPSPPVRLSPAAALKWCIERPDALGAAMRHCRQEAAEVPTGAFVPNEPEAPEYHGFGGNLARACQAAEVLLAEQSAEADRWQQARSASAPLTRDEASLVRAALERAAVRDPAAALALRDMFPQPPVRLKPTSRAPFASTVRRTRFAPAVLPLANLLNKLPGRPVRSAARMLVFALSYR